MCPTSHTVGPHAARRPPVRAMRVPVSKPPIHAERKTAMRPQCIFNDYYKTEQIKKGNGESG